MGRLRRRVGGRFEFDASRVTDDASRGDSMAVNGCCLTVVEKGEGWFAVDAVDETLSRTNLGALEPGDSVNLERPVRLVDRLGGHLVQGHVDGVGTVVTAAPDLRVRAPAAVMRYVVEKGSIAVDGVSLTVAEIDATSFSVAVIPATLERTNLGAVEIGVTVNLEVDVLAKYVEKAVGR